jgi:hypothetical protein
MPAHDQHVVLELEAASRHGETGECVQQRDHDGHVGAPDREHEQDAEEQAPATTPTAATRPARRDERHAERDAARGARALTNCWPGYVIGRPLDQLLELRERHHRARERDRADQAERTIASEMSIFGAPAREDSMQLRERDQRRRAAADAVEQRHHLRHRGHLHAARRDRSETAADQHPERDRPPARRADP